MKNPRIPKWFVLGGTFKRSSSPNLLQKAGTLSGKDHFHPYLVLEITTPQHSQSPMAGLWDWHACNFCTRFKSSQCQWGAVVHTMFVATPCQHTEVTPWVFEVKVWYDWNYVFFPEQQESNLRLDILNNTRTGNYLRHQSWSITFLCLAPSLNRNLSSSVQVQTRIHTDNSSAHDVFDPALGAHWKQDKDRP